MARQGTASLEADAEEGAAPFWRTVPLEAMTPQQWESLCDGCARCCLNKLEDEDTGEIAWTAVSCRLLDTESCRCSDYEHRRDKVPDCIQLTPETARTLSWLPPTCAYRLVAEGRDLYWWHPLVSGSAETVHQAGISVRDRAISEDDVPFAMWEHMIVDWPALAADEC
ncbi:MAG: YcgN family cysteine cluster protein [Bauldia sp.]